MNAYDQLPAEDRQKVHALLRQAATYQSLLWGCLDEIESLFGRPMPFLDHAVEVEVDYLGGFEAAEDVRAVFEEGG